MDKKKARRQEEKMGENRQKRKTGNTKMDKKWLKKWSGQNGQKMAKKGDKRKTGED